MAAPCHGDVAHASSRGLAPPRGRLSATHNLLGTRMDAAINRGRDQPQQRGHGYIDALNILLLTQTTCLPAKLSATPILRACGMQPANSGVDPEARLGLQALFARYALPGAAMIPPERSGHRCGPPEAGSTTEFVVGLRPTVVTTSFACFVSRFCWYTLLAADTIVGTATGTSVPARLLANLTTLATHGFTRREQSTSRVACNLGDDPR
jgi:hypothetical protein